MAKIITVHKRQDENFEDLLRRFKRNSNKAEIVADYRKHEYFRNKAEKRRDKQNKRK